MRLSEAIRLGSTLRLQGFGHYKTDFSTCALGAAADATGAFANNRRSCAVDDWIGGAVAGGVNVDRWLRRLWPVTLGQPALCPACGDGAGVNRQLSGIVAHLNDVHLWKRERIADWVETMELPEPDDPEACFLKHYWGNEATDTITRKKEEPVCV